ncbi:MAG TPA: extracellular solute-binding protein [Clostridia bacterium]|nr:extracellular solute-binding protein [Clostridia bacterium]
MLKKILTVLVLLTMIVPAALAEIPGVYNPPPVNEGQYPVSDGSAKVSWWMAISDRAINFMDTYDKNPAYAQMQKDTGVDIEFIHPTVGMVKEQFNLLCASGDLPDIIQLPQTGYYSGGLPQMYADGLIIDLTPYLEANAPQYLSVINASEIAIKQIYEGENDEVFGFYRLSLADPAPYYRMNLRGDWLEEFGMTEPSTIAEYEAYFDAILQRKEGVTPLYTSLNLDILMGAFDILNGFFIKDGKVAHYANAPEYKDYLALLNAWYQKGYISSDFASLTPTEVQAMFDNGTLGMYPESIDSTYVRTKDLPIVATNAPYLRKDADSVLGNELAGVPVDVGVAYVSVVTTACKDVDLACKLLNYMYTYEGALLGNWGVEGLTYEMGEDGFPHFNAYYTANPDGMTTSNAAYALRCHLGSKYTYSDLICGLTDQGQVANRQKWPLEQSFLRLPPIKLTTDETARRTEILTEVNTYADEMRAKFVVGAEPLENWDSYVSTVESMGLPEAIEITQAAYDRY